jgi:hypothetical protein
MAGQVLKVIITGHDKLKCSGLTKVEKTAMCRALSKQIPTR